MAGRDPHGQTTAEDRLHQREELFRLLVESVREYAIFLVDVTGHISSWNPGAERLKGWNADEIIGQHFSRFYPPEVPRDQIDAELDIAIQDGQFRDVGWRVRKDGTRFWADVTITPVRDTTGRLLAFAKVTRDMTSAKLAEEERAALFREQVARAEAERTNRMKDAFLAMLSHELRTPLNAIVGWSHLLEARELDPEVRRAVDVIQRNAAMQTQLLSDILDISRVSAGKIQLQVARVELDKVVGAALDAVMPAANAKEIQLVRRVPESVPAVYGDPDRLQQVVWNLLNNAVKFTPRGGRVELSVRAVRQSVEVAVRDTGIGILPEFLPHVFEPFRQADTSPTRSYGGLGLGLAIVRHLMELHGGSVRASSEGPGRGSEFVMELPAPAGDQRAAQAAQPGRTAPNLYPLHILVVEDDDDSRHLLEEALRRYGAEVTGVASAEEAMEAFRRRRPDVLVSDLEMPTRSGYDLISTVRALPPKEGGLVPAIAVTAYAHPEDRVRALAAGFQVHVAKPVHPIDLAAAIATVTARTRS